MSARDEQACAVAQLGALPMPLGHGQPASAPASAQRLDEIEARAQAATAGPWCAAEWEIYQGERYEPGVSQWIGETCRGTATPEQDRADAAFVAAARTDVPLLVDKVRLLTAERDALRAECARLAAQVAGVDQLLHEVAAADRITELKAKAAGLSADDWNERYPVGTRVHAYPGTREDAPLRTRTRSVAWTLGHGAAVVMVEGHSAGISLTHVDPVEAGEAS